MKHRLQLIPIPTTGHRFCFDAEIWHALGKTGYVGQILPKGEYHHGQHMVKSLQQYRDQSSQIRSGY